jgi:hypothetical protein
MAMDSRRYQRALKVASWPVVATLPRCAELLGVDLADAEAAAAKLEPYTAANGMLKWSVQQMARQLGLVPPRKRNPFGGRIRT